jgi:hypothetical protein
MGNNPSFAVVTDEICPSCLLVCNPVFFYRVIVCLECGLSADLRRSKVCKCNAWTDVPVKVVLLSIQMDFFYFFDESKWIILGPRIDAVLKYMLLNFVLLLFYTRRRNFEYMDMHCQA